MSQDFWRDSALPFAESRRAQHSRACYRPHTHPTLSVGAVDAGASTLCVAGVDPWRLAAGDVVVIPAERVHACNPDAGAQWSYQMLYLDSRWVDALLSESPDGGCAPGLRPDRRRDAGLYRAFTRLNDALHRPIEAECKESLLIEFVGELLMPTFDPTGERPPSWLSEVQRRLNEQCEQVWPLDQLAPLAGLSRYHFIRVFRDYTGMTPHAFQLDCRINRARAQLRAGAALAELAQSLGFSDQSHFHHAFVQRVAATPREFRRRG